MSSPSTDRRFVLDTNVLVSAVLSADSVSGRAFLMALEHGVLLISEATVEEVARVLSRSKFESYITIEERSRFLTALLRQAELVKVEIEIHACRDPKDDKFLSLALEGKASAIITGDDDLLVLDPFQGIRIMQPAAFLAEIWG